MRCAAREQPVAVGPAAWVAAVLLLVPWPPSGQAAGTRDLADWWLFGPGAASSLTGFGAGARAGAGIWVVVGHGLLYGLPDLPLAAVRVGARMGGLPGAPTLEIGWQKLGRGLYREDDRRVSVQWGGSVAAGLEMRSLAVVTGGEAGYPERTEVYRSVDLMVQAGREREAGGGIRARLFLPLVESRLLRGRQGRRRLFACEAWREATGLAAAVAVDAAQRPTVGVEWYLAWGAAAVGLRAEPAVGVLGPVLVWRRRGLLLRTSHLVHPILGVTHRFELSFGVGPRAPW